MNLSLAQPQQRTPLQRSVELQTIPVRVSNMEFPCSPGGIPHFGPIETGTAGRELRREPINIGDDESIRWPVARTEIFRVVPLKVQFHAIAPHAGIFRVVLRITKCELEAEQLEEPDGRGNIAHHQYRVNHFELCLHGVSRFRPSR